MNATDTSPGDSSSSSSSSSSKVWKFLGCGCLVVILLGVLGGGGIFFAIAKLLKNNDPYRDSIAAVQRNPDAIAALGEPIKPGFFVSGNFSINNGEGSAEFTIPVSGPKGSGKIRVEGSKPAGAAAWHYETWELKVAGEPDPIPLGN